MGSGQLPSFKNPPVVEVVLGVQFQSLAGFGAPHLGLLWQRLRSQYPKIEQRPPIPHVVERIGGRPVLPSAGVSLTLDVGEAVPRIWMLSETGEELLQVQSDRFLGNWRKYQSRKVVYPRYANLKPKFVKNLSLFEDFVRSENFDTPTYDQCEITYVNHMFACSVWKRHADLANVFRGWSADYGIPDAEGIVLRAHHLINDESGKFAGRLHVELDSGYSQEADKDEAVFILKLTARGKPLGEGMEGVLSFLDLGHETIVTGFTAITTPAMHAEWERMT